MTVGCPTLWLQPQGGWAKARVARKIHQSLRFFAPNPHFERATCSVVPQSHASYQGTTSVVPNKPTNQRASAPANPKATKPQYPRRHTRNSSHQRHTRSLSTPQSRRFPSNLLNPRQIETSKKCPVYPLHLDILKIGKKRGNHRAPNSFLLNILISNSPRINILPEKTP
jgi:hypothetical protein